MLIKIALYQGVLYQICVVGMLQIRVFENIPVYSHNVTQIWYYQIRIRVIASFGLVFLDLSH